MSRTTNLLKQNPMFWLWQERITGIVLIGLGIKLALTTRK
jgi:threonine/homoserine/homoserine lactone efflux protein